MERIKQIYFNQKYKFVFYPNNELYSNCNTYTTREYKKV